MAEKVHRDYVKGVFFVLTASWITEIMIAEVGFLFFELDFQQIIRCFAAYLLLRHHFLSSAKELS